MSKKLSEFALDDKISTIRGTLNRLTHSFKSELVQTPYESSPLKPVHHPVMQNSFSDCRISSQVFPFAGEEIDPTQSVVFHKLPSILDFNSLLNQLEELQGDVVKKDSLLQVAQADLAESRRMCALQLIQINSLKEALRERSKLKRKRSCPKRVKEDHLSTIDSTNSANQNSRVESLVKEIMEELDALSPKEIVPRIQSLKAAKSSGSQQRFIDKLADLLLKFSPPGAFEGNPPLRAIWKWIRNLAEDYAKLKNITNIK